MQTSYRKDSEHNYLLFGDLEIDQSEYVYQMFQHNPLEQLLPSDITMRDGKASLRFDITACTPVARRFETVVLSGTDLRRILFAIRETASHLSDLLLDARDLILEPEYIFLGPGQDQIFLCYIPHLSDSSPDTVRVLSEFFLKKTDHSDPAAAALAYAFYDAVSRENYVLLDLLEALLLPEQTDAAPDAPYTADPAERRYRNSGDIFPNYASRSTDSAGKSDRVRTTDSAGKADWTGNSARAGKADKAWKTDRAWETETTNNADRAVKAAQAGRGNRKKSDKNRKKPASKKAGPAQKNRQKQERRKRRFFLTLLLPAILVLGTAAVLILIFRPDLTQIGGAGFLSAAVIWMIHNAIERHSGEIHNVWADEDFDTEDDDAFYQRLLNEAYAQPESPPQSPAVSRRSPFDEACAPLRQSPAATRRESFEATRFLSGQAGFSAANPAAALISLRPDAYPDIPLSRDHLLIGKSPEKADIILPSDTVSRVHARIEKRTDGLYVTDLFSTNGTFLDGHRLEPNRSARLLDSARLTIAGYSYRIQIPGPEASV